MGFLATEKYEKIAENLCLNTKALIDGRLVEGRLRQKFETINPATGQIITSVTSCTEEDVDAAVEAAKNAFDSGVWSSLPPRERRDYLLAFAGLIEKHSQELAVMESLDSGRPICDTLEGDLPSVVECFKFAAEAIDKMNDDVMPSESGMVRLAFREPYGVCAAVLPWNFPILLAAWKIAPMLAAGNCVVVKPAQVTSLTLLKLAELSVEAGIPAGVLNVVPGAGSVIGNALAGHNGIDLITFTGSTAVGRKLLNNSANSNLKAALLELGGKNPCVVMPDIRDLDAAAEEIVSAALWNMGENCTQNSRLIIHKDIKEELVDKILKEVEKWRVGNPMDPQNRLGALVEKKHMEQVLEYIEIGKKEGAELIYGGERILEETGGYFVKPAIFDGCDQSMRIMREEIFGPVVGIETFDTEAEAIAMANDTVYGLQATVWSDDINQVYRLAKGIRVGVVSVNHFSEGDIATPFGGFKQSGFMGRDKSLWANRQYTEIKSVCVKMG